MQKTLRQRSLNDLLELVSGLALVALALLGMGGVIYHTLSPVGLIGPWLGRLWTNHPGFASLVLIGLVTTALAARSQTTYYRGPRHSSDLPLYVFVALGTLFAARWVVNGML